MTRSTNELFEFPKMLTIYFLTTLILSAYLIRSLIEERLTLRRTPLDIPILLFLISYILATIFSVDRYTSTFGYYTRFNGGLLSIICYLVLYYILVAEFSEIKKLKTLLTIFMVSTTLLASYGFLQHFGIDRKYWIQDSQARVFSTIGQPNWLAAYLAALLPLILSLAFYQRNKVNSFFYYLLFVLVYSTFWFTYSRSGLLGFALAMGSFFVLLGANILWQKRFPLITLFLTCLTLSFFTFGFATIRLSETTTEITTSKKGSTGQIRFIVWKGTLDLIKKSHFQRKIIGYGPGTFAYTFLPFRPRELNDTSEWEFLYNKAHNEFLDTAATVGLFGLGAFILILVGYCLWNFEMLILANKKRIKANERVLLIGLFSGWVSLFVTNFFGFLVVPTALLFWLFPALSLAVLKATERQNNDEEAT